MRALLVVNKRSRRGRGAGASASTELAARGIEVVHDGAAAGAATQNYDCIVSVGGDGTLVRVIPQALRSDVPIGVVPAGTFNELARTLESPDGRRRGLRRHRRGTDENDRRRVGQRRAFLNEASIGISSRAARLQTGELKRRYGFVGIAATQCRRCGILARCLREVRYDGRSSRSRRFS